jgi:hypothetical protein
MLSNRDKTIGVPKNRTLKLKILFFLHLSFSRICFLLDFRHFIFECFLRGIGRFGDGVVVGIGFFHQTVVVRLGFGLPGVDVFDALVEIVHAVGINLWGGRILAAIDGLPLAVGKVSGMGREGYQKEIYR